MYAAHLMYSFESKWKKIGEFEKICEEICMSWVGKKSIPSAFHPSLVLKIGPVAT